MSTETIYANAKERYAELGVDTDAAIEKALRIPVSLHCWQTDDVSGLEKTPGALDGGGIMATGNYPGKASTGDEIRQDISKVISLLPGTHRLNLHASYAETEKSVDRDELDPSCFAQWMDWAKSVDIKCDFNPTFFAHPKADDGFTLSHQDEGVRAFWIRHGKACRVIAEAFAKSQNSPCCLNWWTPDGAKDIPADRWTPRARMAAAYDEIFADSNIDRQLCKDFIESKLFGIASEEYVVSSAEFCADYALTRNIGLCMDMGHFHPTETIHGKISSHLQFMDELLLHLSRPIRWDSDHVVLFSDDLRNVMLEIQRGNAWDKVYLALDFFDASINRIGAYVIGTRAARKAILYASLDPTETLREYERNGQNAQRLALMQACTSLPFNAVWDALCEKQNVPLDTQWIKEMETYEKTVLANRS